MRFEREVLVQLTSENTLSTAAVECCRAVSDVIKVERRPNLDRVRFWFYEESIKNLECSRWVLVEENQIAEIPSTRRPADLGPVQKPDAGSVQLNQ